MDLGLHTQNLPVNFPPNYLHRQIQQYVDDNQYWLQIQELKINSYNDINSNSNLMLLPLRINQSKQKQDTQRYSKEKLNKNWEENPDLYSDDSSQ